MDFNLQVVYYRKSDNKCLCFKHAVMEAMKGEDIEVVVDEFGRGGDMRTYWCEVCVGG